MQWRAVLAVVIVGMTLTTVPIFNVHPPIHMDQVRVERDWVGSASIMGASGGQRGAHTPIVINNNTNLSQQASSEGWPGDGSATNPYIIANYTINASSGDGILIRNTTLHIIIRNCTVYNGTDNNYSGIYLYNVTNVTIENVTCHDNYYNIAIINTTHTNVSNSTVYQSGSAAGYGIFLRNASNVTVTNCSVNATEYGIWANATYNASMGFNNLSAGEYGIYVIRSSIVVYNNTLNNHTFGVYMNMSVCQLENNTVANVSGMALVLYMSENCIMRNNTLTNNTRNIIVLGNDLADYIHEFTNNTVDGKGVYYYVNQNNLSLNGTKIGDPGYIGIVSCNNVTVKNMNLTNNGEGMLVVNTMGVNITSCRFYNNIAGIYVWNSNNTNLSICTLYNNTYGLYGLNSSGNLDNLSFYNHEEKAIYLQRCYNYTINNTLIRGCNYGIYLRNSSNTTITYSTFRNSTREAIYLTGSLTTNNTIHHNNLFNNNGTGTQAYDSGHNNSWDDGVGEGNFWNDYTLRYPRAKNDGHVWNESYDINTSTGASDRYPLANPVGSIPTSIYFLSAPDNITAGQFGEFTLGLLDQYGRAIYAPENFTVGLTTNGTGNFSLTPSGAAINNLTFMKGNLTVSFYYTQTSLGVVNLTASNNTYGDVWKAVNITPAPPYHLVISGPLSITAGTPYAYTIRLEDNLSHIIPADMDYVITLQSNTTTHTFYNATMWQNSTIVLAKGTYSTQFYYNDTAAGAVSISAHNLTLESGTYNITVTPTTPYKLTILSSPTVDAIAGNLSGPFVVALADRYDNPAPALWDVIIYFNSTAPGVWMVNETANGTSNVTSITIPTGQYTATFYFMAQRAGTWSIALNAPNLTGTSTTVSVVASAPYYLSFTNAPSTMTAGTEAGPYVLSFTDYYGNTITSAIQSATITLSTNSSGQWEFREQSGGANTTTLTLNVGSGSVHFYYWDTKAGVVGITATLDTGQSDWVDVSLSPGTMGAIVITSHPSTGIAGEDTAPFTFEIRDAYNNLIIPPSDTILVAMSNSSSADHSFYNPINGTHGTTVMIEAGKSQGTFAYYETKEGLYSINLSMGGVSSNSVEVYINHNAPYRAVVEDAPSSAVAGEVFSVVLGIYDQWDNPVYDDSSTIINVSLSHGALGPDFTSKSADIRAVDGNIVIEAKSTLAAVLYINLTPVQPTTLHLPGSLIVNIIPAPTSYLVLEGGGEAYVGEGVWLTAKAYDIYGNFMYLDNTTAFIVESNSSTANTPEGQVVLENGTASFGVSDNTSGVWSFSITPLSSGVSVNNSVSIYFKPLPATYIRFENVSEAWVSTGVDVLISGYDAYNNLAYLDSTTMVGVSVSNNALITAVNNQNIQAVKSGEWPLSNGTLLVHISDDIAERVTITIQATGLVTPQPTEVTFQDDVGPAVTEVSATPNPTYGAESVQIKARITDSHRGGTPIAGAEFFLGSPGDVGEGTPMGAVDGVFASQNEWVYIDLSLEGFELGIYNFYIRGMDQEGNWGDLAVGEFNVTLGHPPLPPPAVYADGFKLPNEGGVSNPTPTITWEAGYDPDGATLTYVISIGTGLNLTDVLAWTNVTGTRYEVSKPLASGSYYVHLRSYDGSMYSDTTSVLLTISLEGNRPPREVLDLNQYDYDTSKPNITWPEATDPDGDDVDYWVQIGTDANSGDILPWTLVEDNYIQLEFELEDGTYYVQIKSTDGRSNSTIMVSPITIENLNHPPSIVSHMYLNTIELQSGMVTEINERPNTLTWSKAIDPDGDPVRYMVMIGTDANQGDVLKWTEVSSTHFDFKDIYERLDFDTRYYIHIRAYDGVAYSQVAIRQCILRFNGTTIVHLSLSQTNLNAVVGSSHTIALTISSANYLNPMNLSITLLGDVAHWATVEKNLVIGPQETVVVNLTVTIPRDIKVGEEHTIRISVRPLPYPNLGEEKELRIKTISRGEEPMLLSGIDAMSILAVVVAIAIIAAVIIVLRRRGVGKEKGALMGGETFMSEEEVKEYFEDLEKADVEDETAESVATEEEEMVGGEGEGEEVEEGMEGVIEDEEEELEKEIEAVVEEELEGAEEVGGHEGGVGGGEEGLEGGGEGGGKAGEEMDEKMQEMLARIEEELEKM